MYWRFPDFSYMNLLLMRVYFVSSNIHSRYKGANAYIAALLMASRNTHMPLCVNAENKMGSTPLRVAALQGHTHCVELLLTVAGVDVNRPDELGTSPLWAAVYVSMKGCIYVQNT